MEEVDFSELKLNVGRPTEEKLERIDLKPYMLDAGFQRRFNKFFSPWEGIIKGKAKHRKKYIANMEEFYGEVLEKFEGLPNGKRRRVIAAETPINLIYQLTNLSLPNVFHDKDDNDYFIQELKMTGLQ
tara:strand:+ start:438 stop:821 length:384 start_codon:yes stop_codon:yes gene_type:complete